MINRDSRGHLYSNDRGEILGPFEDKLLRKHLAKSVFINQERKLEVRWRLRYPLVLTINDAS